MSSAVIRVLGCVVFLLSTSSFAAAADQPSVSTEAIINALAVPPESKVRSFGFVDPGSEPNHVIKASAAGNLGVRDNTPAANHSSVGVPILFELNSAQISEESRGQLAAVAQALQSMTLQSAKILIEGHTDSSGTADINMGLSRARANAVRDFLVAQGGISSERLAAVGKGQTEPAIPENPLAAENRRVVLVNLSN